MKQQKEFYAIALEKNNRFLSEYKNNEKSLTFTAKATNDIRNALIFEKGVEEVWWLYELQPEVSHRRISRGRCLARPLYPSIGLCHILVWQSRGIVR